jgi:hypothetical protein
MAKCQARIKKYGITENMLDVKLARKWIKK